MRPRHAMFAVFALFTCVPALTAGDGDLWILPISVACMAQYPELSSTPLGATLLKAPEISQQVDKAKVCLKSRPWSASELCNVLLHEDPALNPKDRGHFDKLRAKYSAELAGLSEVLPCLWPQDPVRSAE
jgi:hypothetical protein